MDTNETTIEPLEGADAPRFDNAPIGVFDSGFGGLTVAREIAKELPRESIVYLGDSARCPYGPRSLDEVDGFVQQIGAWLVERGVKLVVIACNTATAAGLAHAQRTFPVPVIGVVEPGARAAAHATKNRRVGVIATKATVESDAYTKAIRHLDAGITVFSTATPRFVEIAEQGLRMAEGPIEDFTSLVSTVYIRPAFQEIAREYLEPLRRCDIDTLVLGCTHFPLLKALIGGVVGREVTLISSAQEAGYYADPTSMTTAPTHVDSLMTVMVSGAGAPMFWGSIVSVIVAAACAFVAKKKVGASKTLMVVAAIGALATSVMFRVLIYQLGYPVVLMY